jgi:hypothetical protein
MGRPRKYTDAPLDKDVRISLTKDQKQLIQVAAGMDSLDMAVWARNLLLEAARTRIARSHKEDSERGGNHEKST